MSRITRKEMKRNEMVETVGTVVEYTRDHTRTLLWGAIAVVALLLAVGAFFVWRGQRGAGAANALAAAMEAQADGDEATARERFREIVDEFPRSGAADAARLYLARFAVAEADNETARELWKAAVRQSGDTVLGQQARLNLWELDRSSGRHAELAEEIRGLLGKEDAGLSQDQLLYQLALTLEEAGDDVEARDTYLRIVDEYPQSSLLPAARQRADQLESGAGAGS